MTSLCEAGEVPKASNFLFLGICSPRSMKDESAVKRWAFKVFRAAKTNGLKIVNFELVFGLFHL